MDLGFFKRKIGIANEIRIVEESCDHAVYILQDPSREKNLGVAVHMDTIL